MTDIVVSVEEMEKLRRQVQDLTEQNLYLVVCLSTIRELCSRVRLKESYRLDRICNICTDALRRNDTLAPPAS